jgi:hypothetical protein
MCFVDQGNETPEAGPAGIIPEKQRVIRVFSVTLGDMLQRPASNRQLESGSLSGPEYGDLSAEIKRTQSVLSLCALSTKKMKHPKQDPRE